MSDATHTAHEGHDGHGGDHHDESFYIKIWGLLLGLLVVSVLGPEVGKLLGPGLGTVITLITAFGFRLKRVKDTVEEVVEAASAEASPPES